MRTQGGGGGSKNGQILRTSFMDGPLHVHIHDNYDPCHTGATRSSPLVCDVAEFFCDSAKMGDFSFSVAQQ